jgi:hypothetical protein
MFSFITNSKGENNEIFFRNFTKIKTTTEKTRRKNVPH